MVCKNIHDCFRKGGCNKDFCGLWDSCQFRLGESKPVNCPCQNCPKDDWDCIQNSGIN